MAETKGKKVISTILKVLVYVAISFVCLLAIFLLYYVISSQMHSDDESYKPTVSIYTIVSPSMTPVINVYDVVVNVKAADPTEIEVGDIITYKSQAANAEGMTITHRVVAIDQLPNGTYEYMTQGDNNSEPDTLYVTFDNVIGKEIMIIPGIGRLQFLIANHKWWLILLIIPIGIYLVREILKLIDLFNLRNKVDRVTGDKEDSIIVRKRIENIERKEKIKEELEIRELEKDTITRSKEEPEGFLEKYTETMVSIPINKYDKRSNKTKTIKPTLEIEEKQEEKIEEQEVVLPKTNEEVVEEKNAKQIEKDVKEKSNNEQYEILDTDELSTKIKEYDSKISQLDKMIKDMEVISKDNKKKEVTAEEQPEVDNFLQGERIKVINVELTNNNEEIRNKRRKSKEDKIDLSNKTSSYNPNKKIARPKSEDIKNIRSGINNSIKIEEEPKQKNQNKDRLNLNPRSVKKVNRPGRARGRRNLNLNPTNVKQVRRPNANKPVEPPRPPQPVEKPMQQIPQQRPMPQQQAPQPRKKDRLIKIEKIK